jgi:PAS domain S-box-containing protein
VVRNPAGEVVGFAKVTRDITQRALRAVAKNDDAAAKVLVDNVLDYALYLLDLDGTIKSWNPGAQRIKGYSAQEIIGSNFSVFFTADDVSAGEPIRCLEIARTTGRFEGTGWCVRKDGQHLWVNVVIDAVRDPAGAVVGFAKVTRDLTQSAALRAVTEENGSIAQTLVDSVVDYAIYLLDLDGTVKSWNAGAQRIKGYSAQEMIGRNFSAFFTDDDLRSGEPVRSLAIARASGQFQAEGWRVRKDRTRFWASVIIDAVRDRAGEVVGFAKITRDITQSIAVQYLTEQLRIEREQFLVAKKSADEAAARAIVSAERDRMTAAKLLDAEQERERLIARVGLATQAAQVGIWEWNIRTGAVEWDPIMFRLFGLDSAQGPATYERWVASLHGDDRAQAEHELAQAASSGAIFDTEFRVVWPTGEVRNIRATAGVVRDADGLAERMIGTNWDITEARTFAEQLCVAADRDRAAAATLRETNRMMAMAEEMAHVGRWRLDAASKTLLWSDEMYRTPDV